MAFHDISNCFKAEQVKPGFWYFPAKWIFRTQRAQFFSAEELETPFKQQQFTVFHSKMQKILRKVSVYMETLRDSASVYTKTV